MSIASNIAHLKQEVGAATLVAVSKTKPVEAILEAYEAGQRDFGENYVQELVDKQARLPADIRWHFIGHLQSNKVKYIAPFVHLIHGIDSFKLLKELDKQAARCERTVQCLLQVYIAREESKFGFDREEILQLLHDGHIQQLQHIHVRGLMGMASNTADSSQVSAEFKTLADLFNQLRSHQSPNFDMTWLSGGMSGDYPLALAAGCNMLRIGSSIFGQRHYPQ